ncbi:MAG: ATP-dependent metallopeptidase FtsH/Yme1/Tma family protein, partial [Lysobacter spongiicola]|nr:ATP-dependent metallopeptidase FtsH/Yme1/Tma family protein [Lysobacter spongiicola]
MNDLAKNLMLWVVVAVVLMVVFQAFGPRTAGSAAPTEVTYSQFLDDVESGEIQSVEYTEKSGLSGNTLEFVRKDGGKGITNGPPDDALVNVLVRENVDITRVPPDTGPSLVYILINILPWLLFIGIWIYFMRQMQQGGSKGAMSFGKSKAKLQGEDQVKVTLADVAGCDEAKEEVGELVEFLRDPSRF